MVRDDNRRVREARDSTNIGYTVKTGIARDLVYKSGKGVKSAMVETLLAPESIAPSSVKHFMPAFLTLSLISMSDAECLCGLPGPIQVQFFPNARGRSDARV